MSIAAACLLAVTFPKLGLALNVPSGGGVEEYYSEIRRQIRLGLDGQAIPIKWSDLEPSPGNFDQKKLSDLFGFLPLSGAQASFTLQTVDTNNRAVPSDLAQEAFDSPKMRARLEKLLEWITPQLPPSVKWISLGNEVDVYLLANTQEVQPYSRLLGWGRDKIRSIRPSTPVGVTVTGGEIQDTQTFLQPLFTSADVVFFTYYGIKPTFNVKSPAEIETDFAEMMSFAGSRPVVMQELGMPSSELLGSSEKIQSAFVTQSFSLLEKHADKIKLVSFFIQVDFSKEMVDTLLQYYRLDDGKFKAYLSTLGLRDSSSKPRAAWKTFVQECAKRLPEP